MDSVGSVSIAGQVYPLTFVSRAFKPRFFNTSPISRLIVVNDSPGSVRRSMSASQTSGTMFGWEPPRTIPVLIVGGPSTGCLLFARFCAYSVSMASMHFAIV